MIRFPLPLICLMFVLVNINCIAAVVRGKVTDNHGTPLPYATIFLEGTAEGATANANGNYELNLSAGLYKIACRHIGYNQVSFNLSVTNNETVHHDFVLLEQSLEMKEINILANGEDPAYKIIRNAISKRKYHLDQYKTFQTSVYLKVIGRSRNLPEKFMGKKVKTPDLDVDSLGKGVLYLLEEYADYYKQNSKTQTVIHSVRESGDANGFGFAKLPEVLTFYENNLKIFSTRGSISPISDNAIFYYQYKYLGQFTELGHTVNKIQVSQRRAFEPCFNGYIYITDDDWAIHSLDLKLVKQSGIELFDTVNIQQVFLPQHDDQWVIKSQLIYLTAKIFVFDITANASSLYTNQKLNGIIPDSVFLKNTYSIYDRNATKKDTSYWNNLRMVPLEADEKRNFKIQDSLNKKVDNAQYKDSIRRKANKFKPISLFASGSTYKSKENKNSYSINSLLFSFNFNSVEGLNFAPRLNCKFLIDTGKNLYWQTAMRYGFASYQYNCISRIYYTDDDRNWRGKRWMMGIEGGKYIFQFNPESPIFPTLNSIDALLWHINELKLYERTEGTLFFMRRYGNGFSWSSRFSLQHREPLNNNSNFSFVSANTPYESNLPSKIAQATTWEAHNAALFQLNISWKPGYKFVQFPDYKLPSGSKLPKFTFTYNKGIAGILNSKTSFDKIKIGIENRQSLKLLGILDYKFSVGGFLNTEYVSPPDLNSPYGNHEILGIASPYLQSFQIMGYYDFSNKAPFFGEGHIEYKLKGLISNKIPLFRKTKFSFIIGGNGYFINNSNYYGEAFLGIDNIGWKAVRLFRIDFVESYNSFNGMNTGIRIGINGGNGFNIVLRTPSETNSEW